MKNKINKILKCLNSDCQSNNLAYMQEYIVTEYRKINKNGIISKKVYLDSKSLETLSVLVCLDCGLDFDFEINDNNEIIEIIEK